jgi:cytochrome P450
MGSTLAIDLGSKAFIRDPYPTYRQLRESDQPYWLPHEDRTGTEGIWLFTRFRDVSAILRNTRSISKDVSRRVPADRQTAFDRMLLNMDPPEHTRLRALLAPQFSVRRIADLEADIERTVERLLTAIAADGEADFMADFATRLPMLVIAGIIGVPSQDMPLLKGWTDDLLTGLDSARATPDEQNKVGASLGAMTDYLARLIGKSGHTEETVVGQLTRLQRKRGEPSREELLGMCILLVLAGHETTVNLLGNGLVALLSNPGQLALLRENPGLGPGAIDEMLRYESPLQRGTYRITTESCTIGNCTLEQGQQVSAVIGAANRDPEQFPSPERFDVRRSPNQHLAFGAGVHKCLGERLARLEAKIAFERILERFPRLQLVDSEPDWQDKTLLRGLKTLRVRFEEQAR